MPPLRKVSHLFLYLYFLLGTAYANAETFDVPSGDVGQLIDAINQANENDEEDVINLEAGEYLLVEPVVGYALVDTALPVIRSAITIRGVGSGFAEAEMNTHLKVKDSMKRPFNIAPEGKLTLSHLRAVGYQREFDFDVLPSSESLCNERAAEQYCSEVAGAVALVLPGGKLIIRNSKLSSGRAELGGNIYNAGFVEIVDSGIILGYASNSSGAIFNADTGILRVSQSLFLSNWAEADDGRVYADVLENSGEASFVNTTFSNSPECCWGSNSSITNHGLLNVKQSTIARTNGYGISNYGLARVGASFITAWRRHYASREDFVPCRGNPLTSEGYNIMLGYGSAADFISDCINEQDSDELGNDENPIEPHLDWPRDNGGPTRTLSLQSNSPAVDHVARSSCSLIDQRGKQRLLNVAEDWSVSFNSTCDAGAFELSKTRTPKTCFLNPRACSEVGRSRLPTTGWLDTIDLRSRFSGQNGFNNF